MTRRNTVDGNEPLPVEKYRADCAANVGKVMTGGLEPMRKDVCERFAKDELAFNDAYYLLTTLYDLGPRMATAYLASAKLAAVRAS